MRSLTRIKTTKKDSTNISFTAMGALVVQMIIGLGYLGATGNDSGFVLILIIAVSMGTSLTIFNQDPGLVLGWWRFQWSNTKMHCNFEIEDYAYNDVDESYGLKKISTKKDD